MSVATSNTVRVGADRLTDAEWSHLHHQLELVKSQLSGVIECLQQERERVVLFDCSGLLAALARKDELLRRVVADNGPRNALILGLSQRVGAPAPTLGASLSEALRPLLPHAGAHEGALADHIAQLEALSDVVRELQNHNRKMVRRALGWIEEHLAELVGSGLPVGYDSSGRLREHSETGHRAVV